MKVKDKMVLIHLPLILSLFCSLHHQLEHFTAVRFILGFVLKWACQQFTGPWCEVQQLSHTEFITLIQQSWSGGLFCILLHRLDHTLSSSWSVLRLTHVCCDICVEKQRLHLSLDPQEHEILLGCEGLIN